MMFLTDSEPPFLTKAKKKTFLISFRLCNKHVNQFCNISLKQLYWPLFDSCLSVGFGGFY